MWSRLARNIPSLVTKIERPVIQVARRPGAWETLGGAVSYAGKTIGKPLAYGTGLLGFAHLGSMGVKDLRDAFGIETETQKAEKMIELQKKALENAEKEFQLYKDYLNTLRSMQQPYYKQDRLMPGYVPEWSDLTSIPKKTAKDEEVRQGSGFDWTWLILLAGLGVIAYGVFKKK